MRRINWAAVTGWAPTLLVPFLVVVKLAWAEDLSWGWVFLPIYGPFLVLITALLLMIGLTGPVGFIVQWWRRRRVNRCVRKFHEAWAAGERTARTEIEGRR